MSVPIPDEYVSLLKTFVDLCQQNPSYIHNPSLKFFKDYLISLGATIPTAKSEESQEETTDKSSAQDGVHETDTSSGESEESELELDNDGIIEPDNDEPLPQGQESIEATEDMLMESSAKREQAMHALSEGNKEEAIELLTQSILANPQGAINYAKRAGVLLSLNKPNAVIRDCNKALTLNPDQALSYKYRGRAHRLLGHWEAAAKDLALACKLDYTDEANEWLKEVTPNVKKIQEHNRKYERKRMEKRQREYFKAKAARENMSSQPQDSPKDDCTGSNIPESGSSTGSGLNDIPFDDPEIMSLWSDPEVVAAYAEIDSPGGLEKFYSHPKVSALMMKAKAKMEERRKERMEENENNSDIS